MKNAISIASILRNSDITAMKPLFFVKSKITKLLLNFTLFK